MTGIQSSSCSCELNSQNKCICTVSGRAKIQYTGDYIVMRYWWQGGKMYGDVLDSKTVQDGDSILFDYSGSFDNTSPSATYYIIALAKSGKEDLFDDEKYIFPDECETAPTNYFVYARVKDADSGSFLYNVGVYDSYGTYYGETLGYGYLIFELSQGLHTLTLSKDGYDAKNVSVNITDGITYADWDIDPEPTTGTVTVKSESDGTGVTGADILMHSSILDYGVDTGYTTPHTFTLDSGSHRFSTVKEHFLTSQVQSVVLEPGDSETVICEMTPSGLQCNIDLLLSGEGVTIPSKFSLPAPGVSPIFGFTLPFDVGGFTYYGVGWAVLNEPAPHIVASAFANALEITVNETDITPTITKDDINNTVSFDLFSIIKTMIEDGDITPDGTSLTIHITYATRIWFKTGEHDTNSVLDTNVKTITIPFPSGICSLIPSITGPAKIPVILIPGMLPVVDNTVLDIDVAPTCENLTSPTMVPVQLFLFGSETPSLSAPVTLPATHNISSAIFTAIEAALDAGTPPSSLSVKLQCPAEYTSSGFSSDMATTEISIPFLLQETEIQICDIAVVTDVPTSITPDLLIPGLTPDTTELPVTAQFTPTCDGAGDIPANLLTFITADVYLNDILIGNITPDDEGAATLDLLSNTIWTSSIIPGDTTIEFKLVFTNQLQFPGPTSLSSGECIKQISISDDDDPPEDLCVLTDLDYIQCPDGSTIQIYECVNGIKVPTGATCPDAPECILTNADYIQCPDGSTIQIYECVNGVKVPTGATCPECTEGTFMSPFTCPDGSTIYLLKCVDGDWVDSGQRCPDAPECVITNADYIQCPDGSTIQINECVNGVKVPTGETCPDAPECILTNADYILCHNGSIIQVNECVNGVKVPITPTPTCPSVPDEPCILTNADYLMCPDGSIIQINECVNGVRVPITPTPTCPPIDTCEILDSDRRTCPDGSIIQVNECVNGVRVPTGETCPTTRVTKMVYVTAPMITRVGKKIKIVAEVYCGTEVVGGEKAIVTINGNILTTTHTRNGTVEASWTPPITGIYSICVTIPESSACNAYASSCTTIQVVREMSTDEIEAAEEEFEEAQKRIGEIMERI